MTSRNRLVSTTSLLLLLVAALWGASFLFIRVAVPALGPAALMEARVLIAGVALLLVVRAVGQQPAWRTDWKGYLALGALSAAIPFTLIAAAELHLTASLAAILNATTPLFALLIGAARGHEALTLHRILGVLLGLLGVAVVVGLGPLSLDANTLIAAGASLLAAVFYAIGGIYAKVRFPTTAPNTVATGQQLGAAALLLPASLALPPSQQPTLGIGVAVLVLGLACTALGFALFYRIMAKLGPAGALSVTFLTPVFGLAWGALFLDERLTVTSIAGLAVILVAVALVTHTPGRVTARTKTT